MKENDNNIIEGLEEEPTFIPDPKWTHTAAKEIIKFLREKWNVSTSTYNNKDILTMYDIVHIIMKNYKNEQ